ncbi:MAG: hypothetical protein ACI4IQ_06290 [Eubacterium sp.]
MAQTVPMIVTNSNILVKDKESDEFKTFSMPGMNPVANIPFYHQFAEKIAEGQYYFKEFMKGIYGKKLSKYIFAIIVPDDTSKLESIFINEFFVNSGACKAVAQTTMAQTLSKFDNGYISVSKSSRNVILEYVKNQQVLVSKIYNSSDCDPQQVMNDAKKLHIDIEYKDVPVYVNNFDLNMDEYFEMGEVISPKQFMEKIAVIDVEKL